MEWRSYKSEHTTVKAEWYDVARLREWSDVIGDIASTVHARRSYKKMFSGKVFRKGNSKNDYWKCWSCCTLGT